MAFPESPYPLDPARLDLGRRLHAALTALAPPGTVLGLDAAGIGRLLEQPPDPALGDYALPCFRFAKDLKKKPPEVAEALATGLAFGGWLAKAHAVGAFLNLATDKLLLAQAVLPDALSGDTFRRLAATPANARQKVMIEYSQPNTHKEFHVGHGRNVCLGNALVRLYRYCGYEVVSANYFGDEGTHIATVLWYIAKLGKTPPAERRGEWLGQMYAQAKRLVGDTPEAERQQLLLEISQVHRDIESKSGGTYELWQTTRQWSLDEFAEIYRWMDVAFDVIFYESEVSEPAQRLVDEFVARDVFKLDQGAIGVDLKPFKLGFCILRKRDGNTLYATKDLVLAREKFDRYGVSRSIYVVADEQNHHFKQVFKVLELMGFAQAQQCHHLSYGMVVLPEGKMSSRDGTSVPFLALRDMMQGELATVLEKYRGQWTDAEMAATAKALCDGAIKYGMTSTDPAKEIVFNLSDWLSFEGNSGPYLMYSFTRTCSVLRKAAEAGLTPDAGAAAELQAASEHELLRYLFDFNSVVAAACEGLKPSVLATHLFYMCKAFNRFYADQPVLKAEVLAQRQARLALIYAFNATLRQGLALLGISPPERM